MIDVVYLKNGSILRGIIIERVTSGSIKLKTADGNILFFKRNEIEKIIKESTVLQSNRKFNYDENYVQQRKAYIVLSIVLHFRRVILSGLPVGSVLNLVDFGYLFIDNIGIAAKWFGTAHVESGATLGVRGLTCAFVLKMSAIFYFLRIENYNFKL